VSIDSKKNDLEQLYNSLADTYGDAYESKAGKYFLMRKLQTAFSLGDFGKGASVLEVGCADGPYSIALAKMGFSVTGLDLSSECVKQAAQTADQAGIGNVTFVTGDAEDLSMFPDNTFDSVVSFSCLRYFENPQKAINEIYRVLKKGKRAVIDFPNRFCPWFKYLKPVVTGTTHIHDHQFSKKDVESFLEAAGFSEIKTKRILYTPKQIKAFLLPLMKAIDFVGELPLLNQFAAIIISSGQK